MSQVDMDSDSQALVGRWLLATGEIEPGYQEAHLLGEVDELQAELTNGNDPERVKGELTDVAIAVLGLAVQYDIDLQAEIAAKMELVTEKYSPQAIQFFLDKGYTRAEAMRICKQGYEKSRFVNIFE